MHGRDTGYQPGPIAFSRKPSAQISARFVLFSVCLPPEYTRAEPPKKPQGVNKSQFEAKQTPGQTGITRAEIRNPKPELRKKAILALPGRATGRTQHGLQMPDADSARDPAGAGAVCADKCGGKSIKVYKRSLTEVSHLYIILPCLTD